MTLIIHAPNIHLGGGRTLLLALLSALKQPAVVQLDERLEPLPELDPRVRVIRVAPTLLGRLNAERRLQLFCIRGDILLCFGNLPPLFRSSAQVFVYLQNRYLIGSRPLVGLPCSARLRIHIERLWLRLCLRNATPLVQTETMSQEVREHFGRDACVLPFISDDRPPPKDRLAISYDYLYVASGEPHKNHRHLLQAWIILAKRGFRPSLCLTLDTQFDAELYEWVEKMVVRHDLHISNNPLPPGQISKLYAQSKALIYPSLFESFGLPLLEARRAGIPVIAAERDYVRDVAAPVVSFDPESALSIARAVVRHLECDTEPSLPSDAACFLELLTELAQE